MNRLGLFVALTLATPALLGGHTYQFKTVFRSGSDSSTVNGMASVDGRKVRIDFEQGDDFLFPSAGILLSSDGENLQVFDPAAQTYYDVKLGVLLNPASGMPIGPGGTAMQL